MGEFKIVNETVDSEKKFHIRKFTEEFKSVIDELANKMNNWLNETNKEYDFNELEKIILKAATEISKNNAIILGVYVDICLIKDRYNILVEYYTKKGENLFRKKYAMEKISIPNLPTDLSAIIKEQGHVKIKIELD